MDQQHGKQLLIEMHYLGPVYYFAKLLQYDKVMIERQENFVKSTYRNRCNIAGPNGRLRLSIPVEGGKGVRSKYSEVKIGYSEDWQKLHWYSLGAAYRRSPYFEYYEDQFREFYEQPYEYLFNFNEALFRLVLELLGLDLDYEYTGGYEKEPRSVEDLRSAIRPNTDPEETDGTYQTVRYHQVFEERIGFLKNLSIVDLLFNEGPNSLALLRQAAGKASVFD